MSTRSTWYPWVVAAILFCCGAINYADRTSISSVFPLLRTDLHATDLQLGAIGTVFLWSYAACSPVAGFMADRYSRSRTIFWSLTFWSLLTGCVSYVRDMPQLLASRALLGMAEASYIPSATALLTQYHPGKSRATAIGTHAAGLTFGLVAGGTVAGFFADRGSWRMSFVALAVGGLALAAVVRVMLRDPEVATASGKKAEKISVRESAATILRIPTFWLLVAEGMTVAVGTWIFSNWLPLYFRETFNLSLTAAGFAGTVTLQGAATVGTLIGGVVSDRLSKGDARKRLLWMAACSTVSAPFLWIFLRAKPDMTLITVCTIGFALLRGLAGVNQVTVLSESLPVRVRSTGLGLLNTANCFTGGIGVLAAGMLKKDFGLGGVFAGVSIVALVAAGLAVAASRYAKVDVARAADETRVAA